MFVLATLGFAQAPAPEFQPSGEWFNSEPLSVTDLRGKVVLLDFWTFCCINCMHVLPDLKRLEHKYPDALVVIGVHSAKFANEQRTESIRKAILRYQIDHPVVNDHAFEVWQHYAVRAWPTLYLIDPRSNARFHRMGVGEIEFLRYFFTLHDEKRVHGHGGEGPLSSARRFQFIGNITGS